jgi:hypothetical protein
MKNNFKPKGICLCRNHKQYGTIFINTNKSNIKYIRQIKDDVTNNYSIDDAYVNDNMKLEDVIKIISAPSGLRPLTVQSFNTKKSIDQNEEVLVKQNETSTEEVKNEFKFTKGKLLGKYNGMSVFLNIGKFGYFLKVNGDDKFYNIKHYVDITKIDLEAAISIINDHKKQYMYNNISIEVCDGKYGSYIKYDTNNIKIPDGKINVSQDDINNIIDTYLEQKLNKSFDANDKTASVPTNDINNNSACNPVHVTLPITPPKPVSYVDIIKNKKLDLKI